MAGLGSLALIILAATAFREEIKTQFHVLRLRNDSAYFRSIVNEPEGTSRRAAVRRYLESVEGKVALFRECLEPSCMQRFVEAKATRIAVCVSVEYSNVQYCQIEPVIGAVQLSYHLESAWLELTYEYISREETRTFSEYPGVVFEFLKLPDWSFVQSGKEL